MYYICPAKITERCFKLEDVTADSLNNWAGIGLLRKLDEECNTHAFGVDGEFAIDVDAASGGHGPSEDVFPRVADDVHSFPREAGLVAHNEALLREKLIYIKRQYYMHQI